MKHMTDYRRLGPPVKAKDVPIRTDRYLGSKFLFLSRTEWNRRLHQGEVLVNERVVRPSFRLKEGDRICYFCPPEREPQVNKSLQIVAEFQGILAVYKPPNLPMHEGGAYRKHTFYELLREKLGSDCAAVHRLDRETSGLVLCSSDPNLRKSLGKVFSEKRIEKTYLAIVHGIPASPTWIVNAPLGQSKETLFRVKQGVRPDGAPSETRYECIESKNGLSLLRVFPKTGRTHQIRVHSAFSGHHLVGDKKYHPDESIYLEYLESGFSDRVRTACLTERLCLHATRIRFEHPVTGKICDVESPMPSDMQAIWNTL